MAIGMPRIRLAPATAPVPFLIGAAWLLTFVAQAAGETGQRPGSTSPPLLCVIHREALIQSGQSLWVAVPLFLVGWQVMVAAMMLPASLPSIRTLGARVPRAAETAFLLRFLGPFAIAWSAFGLAAFLGDDLLHHMFEGTPWLGAHPWLIEAGVLALVGIYQLTPMKRRALAACRHVPGVGATGSARRGALRLGIDYALACVGNSWALMLLMFVEGFANLWLMVALTALMVYETTGRHGARAAAGVGVLLALLALVIVLGLEVA